MNFLHVILKQSSPPWVVTPAEKNNYDIMFKKADLDMDGFVSGQEIREIFIQSGCPQNVLAHIWYVKTYLFLDKVLISVII